MFAARKVPPSPRHDVVLDSLLADVHGDGGAAARQRLAAAGAEPVRGDVRDPVVTGEYRLGDPSHHRLERAPGE